MLVYSGEETHLISNIINRLNNKFSTNLSESEKLAVEQIRNNLRKDKNLKLKAKVNSYEMFKHAFEPTFDDRVIEEYSKNKELYVEYYRMKALETNNGNAYI